MRREIFSQRMALLAATWPDRSPSPDTLAAYWLALSHLDDRVFDEATKRCLRECTFYPKPAEILERAERILTDAGALPPLGPDAWAEVLGSFRGRWNEEWSSPAIESAVRSIGGRRAIGQADADQLGYMRHGFLEAYEISRRRLLASDEGWLGQPFPVGESIEQHRLALEARTRQLSPPPEIPMFDLGSYLRSESKS